MIELNYKKEIVTLRFQVLQRDIEAHGRIVSSVVKLGERLARQQREQQKQRENEEPQTGDKNDEKIESQLTAEKESQVPPASRVASSLERRWHLLFLRALEWQCHIEALATRLCNKVSFFNQEEKTNG